MTPDTGKLRAFVTWVYQASGTERWRDHQAPLLRPPLHQGCGRTGWVGRGQGTRQRDEGRGREMTGEQGSVHLHSAVLVPPRGEQDRSDTAAVTQLESLHGAASPCSGTAGQAPAGQTAAAWTAQRLGGTARGGRAGTLPPGPPVPGQEGPGPTTVGLLSSHTRVCWGRSTMSPAPLPASLPVSCLCTGATTCPSPPQPTGRLMPAKAALGGGRMRLGQQCGPGPVVGRCPGANGGFLYLAKSLKGYHRGSATLNGLEIGCPTGHEMPLEGATRGSGSHPWSVCIHPPGGTRAGEADSLGEMVQGPTAQRWRRRQERGLARHTVL